MAAYGRITDPKATSRNTHASKKNRAGFGACHRPPFIFRRLRAYNSGYSKNPTHPERHHNAWDKRQVEVDRFLQREDLIGGIDRADAMRMVYTDAWVEWEGG
jgi:hypothetical protein